MEIVYKVSRYFERVKLFYYLVIDKLCYNKYMMKFPLKEVVAEMIGTFILVVLGCGSIASHALYRGGGNATLNISMSFGFGITFGIIVAGRISGGHLNPAVSLCMLLNRNLTFMRFIFYVLAQNIGAFIAAVMVYAVYSDAIHTFDGGIRHTLGRNGTADIFATYPSSHLTVIGGILDQALGTFIFLFLIQTVTDENIGKISNEVQALIIGFTAMIIGMSFGSNCGGAINPARDFAPRLFTLISGWGDRVFRAGNYFFWIPIVGPFIGSALSCLVYRFSIKKSLQSIANEKNIHEVTSNNLSRKANEKESEFENIGLTRVS